MLKTILGDLKHFVPALNELKKAYEGLEIGDFSNEVLTEFKTGAVKSVLLRYDQNLQTQLDKSGVKNSKLRSIVLQGAEEPAVNLRTAYNNLLSINVVANPYLNYRYKLLELSDISFKDGVFQVLNTEEITENYCRIYLNDAKDKEIYTTLQKTKDALNDFALMAKDLGLPFSMADSGLHVFFEVENDKLKVIPQSIEHSKNYLSNKKALHNAEIIRQEKQSAIIASNNRKAGFSV